jgi:signal transduction histidine kinase
VATTDRPASTSPGLREGSPGRALTASPPRGWWRGWFAPAHRPLPGPVDLLVALVIAAVQVAGTIVYSEGEPTRWSLDAFAYLLLLAGPAALLPRRRWPEGAVAVTLAAAAGYAASGYPRGPAGLPAFLFAVVSAIMMGRRAFAWGALALGYAAFIWLPRLVPDEVERARSAANAAANLAWLPLVVAASEIARSRLERRAERARTAREETRRRLSEERLRIARELHDVLAHNISLINVQSGVALHLLDQRPEQARPALEAINQASDAALGELRSVLDVLSRDAGGDGGPDPTGAWAPSAPATGLRDLDGLLRRTRAAGLDVDLAVEGERRPVPAGVDLAAFRIVQEALTNVVRHAGDHARATVRLTYAPAELVVQVDDDGGPATGGPGRATSEHTGRGIAGMRERVQALGGTFTAGPRPGRGFRVRARFPREDGAR